MRFILSNVRGMRAYLRITLICFGLLLFYLIYLTYWSKCGDPPVSYTSFSLSRFLHQTRSFSGKYNLPDLRKDEMTYADDVSDATSEGLRAKKLVEDERRDSERIDCVINGDYTVPCQRDENEIYLPFAFLKKYFDVYGKVVTNNEGEEHFEWQHSYSKYYVPKGKYEPKGAFMNFENFNVEARERVKCINAMDGVPVSTQWDARGYLYPIQVAQFALSHFSKNISEARTRVSILEDGNLKQNQWYSASGKFKRKWDQDSNNDAFYFESSDSLKSDGISIMLGPIQDSVVGFDLKLYSNGSVTIIAEDKEKRERHFVHYVCNDVYMSVSGNHIYYGMGAKQAVIPTWKHFTRDLAVDIRKGLTSKAARKSKLRLQLISMIIRGEGAIDNLTVYSSAHMAHFFDATEWMVKKQDKRGGWPIPVERKFSTQGMGNLNPGWYSAMAQGQAMSALTRAYYVTGHRRYLESALNAAKLFRVKSENLGVMAKFLDTYAWFEEYPTVPGSFVLNGFIYALIGLHDLKTACRNECGNISVADLFNEGMKSLKALLPFFDSGMGSFYDLRHFTFGIAPNLARWDYHTTHIGQLLLLSTIDDADILKSTAKRWIEYMKGKRAPHN